MLRTFSVSRPNQLSDLIKWEVDPDYTREVATVAGGAGDVPIFTLLGFDAGKYVLFDPAATGGAKTIAAISLEPIAAPTSADGRGLILKRGPAIITTDKIAWPAAVTAAQKAAAIATLAGLGIIVR